MQHILLVTLWTLAASSLALAQSPPVIIEHPRGLIIGPGSDAVFSVVAQGDPPLSYRWRRNGATLIGETNSTLVLRNPTNGNYTVVVSNPYTMPGVLSQWAPLSFFSIESSSNGVGLILRGVTNRVYQLQTVSTAGATNWLALTNFMLPTNTWRFVDYQAPVDGQRYYRAVMLPRE
jgi:hypothetical protein